MKNIWNKNNAQSSLEFTFAMIAIVVMSLGVIGVFHWTGHDLSYRNEAHESSLVNSTDPLVQVRDIYFTSSEIKGASASDIFGP